MTSFPIQHVFYHLDTLQKILDFNMAEDWVYYGTQTMNGLSTHQNRPSTISSARDGLMMLYDMMDGDNWFDNTNWGGPDPCTYFGVACRDDSTIIGLSLDSNNLQGRFNDSIPWTSYLTSLTTFKMPYNQITGTIPSQLGRLKQLWSINIRDNFMDGTYSMLMIY